MGNNQSKDSDEQTETENGREREGVDQYITGPSRRFSLICD